MMSTCPEKDIHSIYIDNELPATYVAEYEAHVKNCPRCQAELARLRAFRQSFSSDSKNIVLNQAALDASFERLQARLSYSKVTGRNIHAFDTAKNNNMLRYITGAAVAAAIIAVVLPVRTNSPSAHNATQFQPVAHMKIQSPADADVKYDGAINTATLSSLLGSVNGAVSDKATTVSSAALSPVMGSTVASPITSVTMYGIPQYVQNDSDGDLCSTLTSYDVFCPMLNQQDDVFDSNQNMQSVSIKFNTSLGQFSLEIGNNK